MFTAESIRRAIEKASKCDMCQKNRYHVRYDGMALCLECYKKRIDRQAKETNQADTRMVPVVFINCSRIPFIDLIMARRKTMETRSRDTLRALVGQRVYLAETGHRRPVIRCSAIIRPPVIVSDLEAWDTLRKDTCIGVGSVYDWKPETKVKYAYPISAVVPCKPFTPPEGTRHGRVWMEYTERKA